MNKLTIQKLYHFSKREFSLTASVISMLIGISLFFWGVFQVLAGNFVFGGMFSWEKREGTAILWAIFVGFCIFMYGVFKFIFETILAKGNETES